MKNVYKSTNLNEPRKDDLFIVRFFYIRKSFFFARVSIFLTEC